MRKNFLKCVLFCFLVFFVSCATTKKKDENYLGDFNSMSLGEIMGATVSRTKNQLNPRVISLVFAPRTNLLSFHHKFMGDNIWITLDYQGRQTMIAAINRYLDTYKSGELNAANEKTKAYFGKTEITMDWGLLGTTHKNKPTLRFEYQRFGEKKLPYFIMASKTEKAGGTDEANSPAIRIALSPAKCQEFLEYLKQENLLSIVQELQADFEKYEANDFDNAESKNLKDNIEKESTETETPLDIDESDFEF